MAACLSAQPNQMARVPAKSSSRQMSGCTALVPIDKTCCRAFSSFIGSSHCTEVMLKGHGGERAGLHTAIERSLLQ